MTVKLLLIALGGAAGSVLRYLLAGWFQGWTTGTFPLGTLLVNISGCLAIGVLASIFMGPVLSRDETRLLVLVGLLGGYTTFSSFGWETLQLLNRGQVSAALLYVGASNILGIGAAWAGSRAVAWMYGGAA